MIAQKKSAYKFFNQEFLRYMVMDVKEFQAFANLTVTGKLDAKTVATATAMAKQPNARCGLIDLGRRKKRFVLQGWSAIVPALE